MPAVCWSTSYSSSCSVKYDDTFSAWYGVDDSLDGSCWNQEQDGCDNQCLFNCQEDELDANCRCHCYEC